MGRKRTNKSKPNTSQDGAFFPRTVGKWFLVFTDGNLAWVSPCRRGHCCPVDHPTDSNPHQFADHPKTGPPVTQIWTDKGYISRNVESSDECQSLPGKFVVQIATHEVIDSGLEQTRSTTGPWHPGALNPRWAHVTWYQREERKQLISNNGATHIEKDWQGKVILALYPPGVKHRAFRYRSVLKWHCLARGLSGFSKVENGKLPCEIAASDSDRFSALRPDSAPRRILWWIRRNEKLVRSRIAPSQRNKVAATVYHFCPLPGTFARVEIVQPYTDQEWQAIHENQRPQSFGEQLDIMREHILRFKDTPEMLQDPHAPLGSSWRRNPVWSYFNDAGVALDNLKHVIAYDDASETRESVKARIEFAAQQALALGENYIRLLHAPKIAVVRKREKMDKPTGRRKKQTRKFRDALRQFVIQYRGKSAGFILERLKIAIRSGNAKVKINDGGFFHHPEELDEFRESTVRREISDILRAMKKSR
jgi:hypothetical protein